MGKFPIIFRRGTRDSDREKSAVCTLDDRATGTACVSAPAASSAATGSAATGQTVARKPRIVLSDSASNNDVSAENVFFKFPHPGIFRGEFGLASAPQTDCITKLLVNVPTENVTSNGANDRNSTAADDVGSKVLRTNIAVVDDECTGWPGQKIADGATTKSSVHLQADFRSAITSTRDNRREDLRTLMRSSSCLLRETSHPSSSITRDSSSDACTGIASRTAFNDVHSKRPEHSMQELRPNTEVTDSISTDSISSPGKLASLQPGVSARLPTGISEIGKDLTTSTFVKLNSGNFSRPPRSHQNLVQCRSSSSGCSWHSRVVSLLLGLLAMNMLCRSVVGIPAPSPDTPQTISTKRDPQDVFEEAFDEDYVENNLIGQGGDITEDELQTIRKSIMQDLGLQRLPDPSKANISQAEYERAHREYLRKIEVSHQGRDSRKRKRLHIFYATDHPENKTRHLASRDVGGHHRHALYFPMQISNSSTMVDHATLRLLLDGDASSVGPVDVLVYATALGPRRLIAKERLDLADAHQPRWVEFDSTEAATSWHRNRNENFGLEVEFFANGAPIRRTIISPALNVFTTTDVLSRRCRAAPEHLMSLHRGRRTECRGDNKKCCRHQMTVIFKDLKGFDFIVQPKTFDAGYCKGRCPPRYNPAHHHALLQSLIWKEDRRKAPKPCCAPSKLAELEILYFDDEDSTKLKVSNWKNMRVLECACS